jgi:hypothetical protein
MILIEIGFWLATLFLAGAAAFDGYTTVKFRHAGYEEANPLFGKKPSALRVIVEGTAIIAFELFVLLLAKTYIPHIGPWPYAVLAIALGVQANFHVRAGVKNLQLPGV